MRATRRDVCHRHPCARPHFPNERHGRPREPRACLHNLERQRGHRVQGAGRGVQGAGRGAAHRLL
eukprot:251813-Pleurochrysis_carterae.AAC.1